MKKLIPEYTDGIVSLRLLTYEDLERTLIWRNQIEVRKWFKNSCEIDILNHKKWYVNYLIKDDDYVFIAEINNESVGQMAVYNIANNSAEIGRFIVSPEAKGKGMMKLSIQKFISFIFKEFSVLNIYLDVLVENKKAIHIYKNLGFKTIDVTEKYRKMRLNYAS